MHRYIYSVPRWKIKIFFADIKAVADGNVTWVEVKLID